MSYETVPIDDDEEKIDIIQDRITVGVMQSENSLLEDLEADRFSNKTKRKYGLIFIIVAIIYCVSIFIPRPWDCDPTPVSKPKYLDYCHETSQGSVPYYNYLNPETCHFFNPTVPVKEAELNIYFEPFVDIPIGLQDSAGGIVQNTLFNIGGDCGGGFPYCCAKRGFFKTSYGIDLNGKSWIAYPEFPGLARAGLKCVVANEEMFCWGGFSYDPAPEDMALAMMQKTPKKNPYGYVDGYKLNTQFKWEKLPLLPNYQGVFTGMCFHKQSNAIYLIGGADDDKTQFHVTYGKKAWKFSLETYQWTSLPDLPGSARFSHSVSCLDDIYVIGGNSGGQSVVGAGTTFKTVIDNWKFNTNNMTWTSIQSTPYNLANFCHSVVYKEYIIMVGGHGYDEIYNHKPLKNMIFSTGKGYIQKYSSSILVYNTIKDYFFLSNELPLGNNCPFVAIKNDTIFIIGGETNTGCVFGKLYGQHPKLVMKGKILIR